VVEYVLKGKYDIMNISPSDGFGFCECERCRALDVPGVFSYDKKHPQISDRIFTYANEVARRVREKNPEKACGILAYTFYHQPPVKLEKIEPNIMELQSRPTIMEFRPVSFSPILVTLGSRSSIMLWRVRLEPRRCICPRPRNRSKCVLRISPIRNFACD